MIPLLTILVVEDDTSVRNVVLRMLSERGFAVLTASTAYEALSILRDRPVDLLFADIIMPGMDGVDMVKEAQRLRPGIKVLFSTAYPQVAAKRGAFRQGRVLYKPFRDAELFTVLQALLPTI